MIEISKKRHQERVAFLEKIQKKHLHDKDPSYFTDMSCIIMHHLEGRKWKWSEGMLVINVSGQQFRLEELFYKTIFPKFNRFATNPHEARMLLAELNTFCAAQIARYHETNLVIAEIRSEPMEPGPTDMPYGDTPKP